MPNIVYRTFAPQAEIGPGVSRHVYESREGFRFAAGAQVFELRNDLERSLREQNRFRELVDVV